ncbi:MAG: hypothetical protein P4L91_03370 [Burkholderiaceae bacterium]|nr:hypothetical protein [Burkholderiaceae bacterium]
MYTLNIEYNDAGPFTAISAERGGLGVHLYNSAEGYVHLRIMVKNDGNQMQDYWVKTIKPGDRLKFTYSVASSSTTSNITEIEGTATQNEQYEVPAGYRIGFDVQAKEREKIRLSHPPEGGFDFMLANIPLNHARCSVMAENEEESWNWQLNDLFENDWIQLDFVETTWNSRGCN